MNLIGQHDGVVFCRTGFCWDGFLGNQFIWVGRVCGRAKNTRTNESKECCPWCGSFTKIPTHTNFSSINDQKPSWLGASRELSASSAIIRAMILVRRKNHHDGLILAVRQSEPCRYNRRMRQDANTTGWYAAIPTRQGTPQAKNLPEKMEPVWAIGHSQKVFSRSNVTFCKLDISRRTMDRQLDSSTSIEICTSTVKVTHNTD